MAISPRFTELRSSRTRIVELLTMLMPLLSEADPQVSAEGSIDPLGIYAIADALAVRMIPGVRERQQHPRFLTSIAVSLSLCNEFDDELVASDGVSEPWQVFEWHLVEGMSARPRNRSCFEDCRDRTRRQVQSRTA